jgi:hypothetical protein
MQIKDKYRFRGGSADPYQTTKGWLQRSVPEHFQQPAPTVSEHAHVVSDEIAEQPRLEPMKWGGSEREEIRKRIATFRAHQQRFTREREDYALSS